jgi:hypothetical protein
LRIELEIVEQASLAFRRFDLISFISNMNRFAIMMNLDPEDNPLAIVTEEEEEMKAPLTEREKQIEAIKKQEHEERTEENEE